MIRVVGAPPNYGRTTVSKTAGAPSRLIGGEPADRRGSRSNNLRLRRGRR